MKMKLFYGETRVLSIRQAVISACFLVVAFGGIVAALNAYATFEAESGSVTTASVVNDTSASGGRAVKFGSGGITSYPTTPPAQICGNTALLSGPSTAPSGATTVPAGDNSGVNFNQADKTFWFAPGTHTLGGGQYAQIIPGNRSTYVGAPGAILGGQSLNSYAFTQHATDVTIRYLTIPHSIPPSRTLTLYC